MSSLIRKGSFVSLKPYYSLSEIQDAYLQLGMSIQEALLQERLRYAIPIELGDPRSIFKCSQRKPELAAQVDALPNEVHVKEVKSVHADGSELTGHQSIEDCLYVRHSQIRQAVSGKTLYAYTLETFDGDLVNLWGSETATDEWWPTVWLEPIELGHVIDLDEHWMEGCLAKGRISTKEFVSATGERPELDKKSERQQVEVFKFHKSQPDRAAKAMLTWGNRLANEKGRVPTADELKEFMIENQASIPLIQEGTTLFIDGQRVTERQFPTRYDNLRSWKTHK